MARGKKTQSAAPKSRDFYDKLVLNLFLIHLFGINVFEEYQKNGQAIRPFRRLTERLEGCKLEGLADDGLHYYFHELTEGDFFEFPENQISKDMLLEYEKNIVALTNHINEHRSAPIQWKYYQYLALVFVEIYLDRYFGNREKLLKDLNAFIKDFNAANADTSIEIPEYKLEDLNKICMQNATGSGKTLLMAANFYQYRHYLEKYNQAKTNNGLTFLITPNERLSAQNAAEFNGCGMFCVPYNKDAMTSPATVYSLEVQKLADKDGEKSVNTAALGNQNLLFIDEGHTGLASNTASAWYSARSMLCDKGFAFEYSATFKQAVEGTVHENEYAKAILFDYSYRWFYEDGYGKDYQIFNFPDENSKKSDSQLELYLTASLLKFAQQLLIYEQSGSKLKQFNIEKPLWVWVGHSVGGKSKEDAAAQTDVEKILKFLAGFLLNQEIFQQRIIALLTQNGRDNGLIDDHGNDLFFGAFATLKKWKNAHNDMTGQQLYNKILSLVFHTTVPGGHLVLDRVKGDTGEILLKVSTATEYFGEINVSAASELCTALEKNQEFSSLIEIHSDSTAQPMFDDIKNSTSPINLLIGAKKFAEGWDCWRVSLLGLLNVGKTEGPQIIQLFGRGVRLKGFKWSLKRSSHLNPLPPTRPDGLQELELLCVFGVSADAMVKFKEYLQKEMRCSTGKQVITVPLTVCQLDNKKLKVLCPKQKKDNGKEYNFKVDGPVPEISGDIPEIIQKNRIVLDWYPKIQSMIADDIRQQTGKFYEKYSEGNLCHLTDYLDFQELYFVAEHWKRQNAKYNYNCSLSGIKALFEQSSWYQLLIPQSKLHPQNFQEIQEIQNIARVLLEKYLCKLYDECNNAYMKPRLEYRVLDYSNENIPEEQEYQIIYDESDESLKTSLLQIVADLKKYKIANGNQLGAIEFSGHLFNPLFFSENSNVKIVPCSLNASEYRFVKHLSEYQKAHQKEIADKWGNIYLLRNQSRGKGMGFFEANNFYPDFILWCIKDGKQFITFIEPHGLKNEGPGSPKIQFCKGVKDIQKRLNDPSVVLNSFILSPTALSQLQWGLSEEQMKENHILFQGAEDGEAYISQLFDLLEKDNVSHIRSNKAKSSRNTYHQTLISELLKSGENNTRSLEDLVACWAVLSKPEAVAEALGNRDDVKSWKENYPDKIKDDESIITALRYMIDRSMISISKDLKVSLRDDCLTNKSNDVKMDAAMAMEAVTILHQTKPQSFCFAFDKFISADFLTAARRGDFAYAA
ncbi:MAG: DEAD/DEAH box helicase family protein [Lentisphaeria bacterium]|nr:DEAD/DEAH box helicase family protein [Lentisphaeria bacterium]